jgi:hypothetical protein
MSQAAVIALEKGGDAITQGDRMTSLRIVEA